MADYQHGVYAKLGPSVLRQPASSAVTPVYVGTAPAHQAQGGAGRVNEPVLLRSLDEARQVLGYSDDWASYTLCEAMDAHFANGAQPMGPIVAINVLDPTEYQAAEAKTVEDVPVTRAGALLEDMEQAIVDTIAIADKTLGEDFTARYDPEKKTVRLRALPGKSLGERVTVSYRELGEVTLTEAEVIGAPSEVGAPTGVYAVEKVYQATGRVPYVLCAPGWSQIPAVRDAMVEAAVQISGHWHALCMTDLPLADGDAALAIDAVAAWKQDHGYTAEHEIPCWPMVQSRGRVYHLSTLATVTQMRLDHGNGDLPYESVDNKPLDADGISLHGGGKALYGPEVLNQHLVRHGILTAVYWGGLWRCWGPHTGAFAQGQAEDPRATYAANVRMLLYLINWFQLRFGEEIGKPYTRNRAQSIQAECQAYLDALRSDGALVYGACTLDQGADADSDVLAGAIRFSLAVTNTPPLRTLEATLRYDETGLSLIFAQ